VSKIIQKKARILSNLKLIRSYYKLTLELPEIAQVARPGQFVMLRINRGRRPFLRRPFSIHNVCNNSYSTTKKQAKRLKLNCIEILYEVVGRGTEILSKRRRGEYLDVIGPLGNGFNLIPSFSGSTSILVAGCMGVAPLFFLGQTIIERNQTKVNHHLLVLIGAKRKEEVVIKKDFEKLGLGVKISTDDGSAGFRGRVTDLLRHLLTTQNLRPAVIYACGPKSMLREITRISKQYRIPAQISLDEYMACGLGVCLGCVIQTKEGQKLVCKDGPVFDAAEIRWYNKKREHYLLNKGGDRWMK